MGNKIDQLVREQKTLDPIPVEAELVVQFDQEVLAATCPKCRTVAGVTGGNRHLCRTCWTLLLYVPKKPNEGVDR